MITLSLFIAYHIFLRDMTTYMRHVSVILDFMW